MRMLFFKKIEFLVIVNEVILVILIIFEIFALSINCVIDRSNTQLL